VTIQVEFRFETRPYTGYVDPAFPIGAWIGSGRLLGNATGGVAQMNFLAQQSEAQRVTELYNIEQVAVSVDHNSTILAAMFTEQMDVLNPNVRATQVQRWRILLTSDSNDAIMSLGDLAGLPIWLGAPTDGGAAAGISFTFPNIDTRNYDVTVQGYIWGPRSMVAPGGPQRPPFGYMR